MQYAAGTLFIVDDADFLPDQSLAFLEQLKFQHEVIMLGTEFSDSFLEALLRRGVRYFIAKPSPDGQLVCTIRVALKEGVLRNEHAARTEQDELSHIKGLSRSVMQLRNQAAVLGASDIPVLITGESGTGKEVTAREFHRLSRRSQSSFVPVNCATLGSLAESELFGHTRGAFTHAVRSTQGYIGAAQGGTLLLDEVGELGLPVQTKLLRFLDSGEYSRVGESGVRQADVRIIAATNQDLWAMNREGTFRKDLLFRLAGAVIRIPPLREHLEDVPVLSEFFLRNMGRVKKQTYQLTPSAMTWLQRYYWPGNVRQLRQLLFLVAEKTVNRCIEAGDIIQELHAWEVASHNNISTYRDAKLATLRNFELQYFSSVLSISCGSLKRSLAITGMHKKNYYAKLQELGLCKKRAAN